MCGCQRRPRDGGDRHQDEGALEELPVPKNKEGQCWGHPGDWQGGRGTPAWPVAGLEAACKCLCPDSTALPALGGADE